MVSSAFVGYLIPKLYKVIVTVVERQAYIETHYTRKATLAHDAKSRTPVDDENDYITPQRGNSPTLRNPYGPD